MILLSPTGPYYASPMKIYVEEKYTRAAPGGVGFAKNAGNYGGALKATSEARAQGYDQVLWTDAFEHKWLQEVGTMNVFFVFGNTVVTPSLEEGTILEGVTRDSVIQVLREQGLTVEERKINIDEVVEGHRSGKLTEIFGSGTAATISPLKELRYKDYSMHLDVSCLSDGPGSQKNPYRNPGREKTGYPWLAGKSLRSTLIWRIPALAVTFAVPKFKQVPNAYYTTIS